MSAQNDIWQIMIDGQVYEADTETLKAWATEGRILGTDKVKKGALNWNEANRIPMLRAILSGQAPPVSGVSSTPVVPAVTPLQLTPNQQNNLPQYGSNNNQYSNTNNSQYNPPASPAMPVFNPAMGAVSSAGVCRNHPQEAAKYICRVCSATFCKACPKVMGTMAICMSCGDMCNKIEEVVEKATYAAQSTNFYGQGKEFGAPELIKAFKYPLQFPVSLVSGVILYAFLVFGSGFSWLITGMKISLLFSCMSLIIRHVSAGRMDRNFLPDISSFTFVEDILKPVLLSIAVILVAFLPSLLVLIVFLRSIFALDGAGVETLQEIVSTGLIVVILGGIGGLWGLFYYPMAMAIAGFTQDFWSVINPTVGIDTMRRMGPIYIKAFLMYLVIFILGTVVNVVLAMILSPILAVPFFGGLFYNAISGGFTFYTSLVVACVLGTALYKCADELDIAVDK